MEKELYVVEYTISNDGEYEDYWITTETFGVFENFADARDAIRNIADKHKLMSDNKVEDDRGDVYEFCAYDEKYIENQDAFCISWCMDTGLYMCNYTHSFDIKEMEIGNYDPDIAPGF